MIDPGRPACSQPADRVRGPAKPGIKGFPVPCVAALWMASFATRAWAQPQAPAPRPPPPTLPNPSRGGNLLDFFSVRTPLEFWLTCVIIAYGIAVLVILLWALRAIQDRKADDVTRSVIVVTVIFGALVLVTAGFTNEQTAPVFGLFGTIVGYILGRMSRQEAERPSPAQEPAPPP